MTDLEASQALANEMAAALAETFPRVRITQLEPVQAVARGVFALIEKRLAEPYDSIPNFLTREEIGTQVLAECLATWQAGGMEAAVDKFTRENEGWTVSFGGGLCVISDRSGAAWFHGDGAAPSLALGKALEAFDARGEWE